jgi:hypothetical protein
VLRQDRNDRDSQVSEATDTERPPAIEPRRRFGDGVAGSGTFRVAASLAGPVVIVASVVAVLHSFAFGGLISTQHADVLPLWLPNYCFLGKSLAAGHLPAWNPYVMGGVPFAADPQSGWLSAPAMLLFSALPCQLAIRWFIVLQPILAGLGVYWLLHGEGCSRPAATVGGLVLALGIAGSLLALSLPFAASLAWTALLLAAASRLMRSTSWASMLIWVALTALAWGQLAAAHLSLGFVMGSGAFLIFLAARTVRDVRTGTRPGRHALLLSALLLAALPLVNLGYFLPRLAYLSRTSIGQGYSGLDALAAHLRGVPAPKPTARGIPPTVPLRFDASPGLYLGATGLALAFAGWRARRVRHLAVAFSLFGSLCYALSLNPVVHALLPWMKRFGLGSFYLHDPPRLIFGLVLALAVLAGIGVEAWRDEGSAGTRLLMVAPAVLVWGVLPVLLGLHRTHLTLPVLGALAGALALTAAAIRPSLLVLLPIVLATELTFSGLSAQSPHPDGSSVSIFRQDQAVALYPLRRPAIQAAAYVRAGPIADYLMAKDNGRYLSIAPRLWSELGYHVRRTPPFWGFMATQRSMVFRIEEGQGYNSTQLLRYWTFLRAADTKRIKYNAAGFIRAEPIVLDLLQVAYLDQPVSDSPVVPGEAPVAQEGRWVLYRLPDPSPRASIVPSWKVVASASAALTEVIDKAFEPARQVILERDPGLSPPSGGRGAAAGTATYRPTGDQSATIVVDSPRDGMLLVRNAYDPHWHARVDGQPVPVLAGDYLVQAVSLPAGHHTVQLSYDDPSIGYGLLGSSVALVLLFSAASTFAVRARREASRKENEDLTASTAPAESPSLE